MYQAVPASATNSRTKLGTPINTLRRHRAQASVFNVRRARSNVRCACRIVVVTVRRPPSPRPFPTGRGGATTVFERSMFPPAVEASSDAAANVRSSSNSPRAPSPGGEGWGEGELCPVAIFLCPCADFLPRLCSISARTSAANPSGIGAAQPSVEQICASASASVITPRFRRSRTSFLNPRSTRLVARRSVVRRICVRDGQS